MPKQLHEQAIIVYCKGAIDPGTSHSGVERYFVYALRADTQNDSAPSDSLTNFNNAYKIGTVDNLNNRLSYRDPNEDPVDNGWKVRDYNNDGLNQYKFYWYQWESGFNYRFWVAAVDKAGNAEPYTNINVTTGTSTPMYDTRAPQLTAYKGDNKISYNAHQKTNSKLWTLNRSGSWFEVEADNGNFPDWHNYDLSPNPDPEYFLSFKDETYIYIAEVLDNDDLGSSGADRIQVYCSQEHPIHRIHIETRALNFITDIINLSWTTGQGGIFQKPTLTMGIGSLTLEFRGVGSLVGDLDHYNIERYVEKEYASPIHVSGHYGYESLKPIEETEFLDFNIHWLKENVGEWGSVTSLTDEVVYDRGLYLITPVDEYTNSGLPITTTKFTNFDIYNPATGIPPTDISSFTFSTSDNGTVILKWNDPTDDDLRGFQIQRKRGTWGGTTTTGSDNPDDSDWTWGTWESIVSAQDKDEFDSDPTYDRAFTDIGLDPFSASADLGYDKVGYQYRIRATDWSGNTSQNWIDFSSNTIKAVDTTVDTTGSNLVVLGKQGTMGLEITQPNNNGIKEAKYVHIYRSLEDNSHYSSDPDAGTPDEEPFTVDLLPTNSPKYFTIDTYPPPEYETVIYYKLKFEDEWGNISGFVNETYGTSKTGLTSVDSNPPYVPTAINASYRVPLPGTIAVSNQSNRELTYTPGSTEVLTDYLSAEHQFEVFNAYGDNVDRRYTVESVTSSNVIVIEETLTNTFTGKDLTDEINSLATITFTRPNKQTLSGTVSITNGSNVITGTSTNFDTDFVATERILFEGTSGGDVAYEISSVDSATQITLKQNIAENTATGLSYKGSQDYRDATIFKRYSETLPTLDSDFGNWEYVGGTGSSQISTYVDKTLLPGYWQYGISSNDVFSNDSSIGIQSLVNGASQSPAYIYVSDTVAPESPEDISVTGGNGRVTFSWSRPSAGDIDYYTVEIRDHTSQILKTFNTVYAEEATWYNKTNSPDEIAKRDSDTTQYWSTRVTVYDLAGNSASSLWQDFDEREGASQNAYLSNYNPASGSAPTTAGLDAMLGTLDSSNNGGDADVILTSNNLDTGVYDTNVGSGATRAEIEKFILYAEVTEAESSTTYEYLVAEFTDRSGDNIILPNDYHHTNILRESDDPTSTIKYKFVGITWDGMRTDGTYQGPINVTDTAGPSVLTAGFSGEMQTGAVLLSLTDVIDKDGAKFEIWRSPGVSGVYYDGTEERIITVGSSRSSDTDNIEIPDLSWNAITGNIPDNKTTLPAGSYNGEAYYKLMGVDRFGNRNTTDVLKIGPFEPQYYAPSIPIDETCVAFFPFETNVMSTKGHVPVNTDYNEIQNACTVKTGGKWNSNNIEINGKFLLNGSLLPINDFTIDMYIEHGWVYNDNIDHYFIDTGVADTQNRVYILKTATNQFHFAVYGGTLGGYKRINVSLNGTNFPANSLRRITGTFKDGTLKLYFNGTSVGTSESSGTWTMPTTWGSTISIGSRYNYANQTATQFQHLSIWNEQKQDSVIQTWADADRSFQDITGITSYPGIANENENHITSEVNQELIRNVGNVT